MKEQDAAHSSLSPCPFCGLFPEWINETIPDGHFYIRCPHCHIVMKEDRRDKVIGMWNRREEIQQESELKLWSPILEYMRTHPDRRLGESIPDRVLEFLKEHSRLKSELQQKDEAVLELSEILVIAYDALSVVRTEPTMSGSVLASFDKNKFIKIRGDFFEFLDKHKTLESLIKKAKLNN